MTGKNKRQIDPAVWSRKKIRNRLYEVTHKQTGRKFRVTGHPNIHKWWADEILHVSSTGKKLKDPRHSPTPCTSYTSMVELLILLKRHIEKQQKKPPKILDDMRRPAAEWSVMKKYGNKVRLRRRVIDEDHDEYVDDDKGIYWIMSKGGLWKVFDHTYKVTIGDGLPSRDVAWKVLVDYISETGYQVKAPGKSVEITVQKRPDRTYLITTIRSHDNDVVTATIENDEEGVKEFLQIEVPAMQRIGYEVSRIVVPEGDSLQGSEALYIPRR